VSALRPEEVGANILADIWLAANFLEAMPTGRGIISGKEERTLYEALGVLRKLGAKMYDDLPDVTEELWIAAVKRGGTAVLRGRLRAASEEEADEIVRAWEEERS
jgi:hypothetical protein